MDTCEVSTVFVSPLRRTLETAYNVFKSHPNFNKIQFYADPSIREGLGYSCDIANPIDKTLSEWSQVFPNFNTQLVEDEIMRQKEEDPKSLRDLWFVDLHNPKRE